jgi:hypothetical protein
MLHDIVDSKTTSALLSFLLMVPPRAFSPLELQKRLGLSTRRLREGMRDLMRQQMLIEFSKHNKKYYLVSSKHPLLAEVRKSLLKNQRSYDDELFVAIGKLGQIKAAFLSGIFTGQPQLPVDLLLVGKVNLNRLATFLEQCRKMMGQDINYSVMSDDEFILRRDTFDRFIKDIFDYRHIIVIDQLKGKRTRT